MGGPKPPRPVGPPPAADTSGAFFKALDFAETERKLRKGRGRRSTFLTTDRPPRPTQQDRERTFLGQ